MATSRPSDLETGLRPPVTEQSDEPLTPSTLNASPTVVASPSGSKTGFPLSANDLVRIVDFDSRTDSAFIRDTFHTTHGGQDGLVRALRTDSTLGLACDESGQPLDKQRRVEAYGTNSIEIPPRPTIFQLIWSYIKSDAIIQVLIVGACVILAIGTAVHPSDGWYEGTAIFIAVLIVLLVTAGNDWIKEGKFRKMMEIKNDLMVNVMRSGIHQQISTHDLLPGDLVLLSTGDQIPADGFLLSANRLALDESPLTGEPIACKKDPVYAPFVFGGTFVGEGSGAMVVTAVGKFSSGGRIQELLFRRNKSGQTPEDTTSVTVPEQVQAGAEASMGLDELTPLQHRLRKVAWVVSKIGIAAGIVTFIALAIRWAVSVASVINGGGVWSWSMLLELVEFLVTAVTVVVVSVPEGLPLAVTISLAYSMFRMMKDNCFVRHLDASETMGEATCICTDKTGTLTENRMTVVKVSIGGKDLDLEKGDKVETLPQDVKQMFAQGAAVNSSAELKPAGEKATKVVQHKKKASTGPQSASAPTEFVGSATEGALLVFGGKLGFPDYQSIRREAVVPENGIIPFTSARKRMSTLVRTETGYRLHVKGASEIVLGLCTRQISEGCGLIVPMEADDRLELEKTINKWAGEGLRTIALAYRDFDMMPDLDSEEPKAGNGEEGSNPLETDLVFLALVGIKDPLRPEVPDAVAACQRAGMVVRMVTGDNILTATKIASECGILDESQGHLTIEGPEFRQLTDEGRKAILPKLRVLARSSPSDKFILVSLLRSMGETVAVTGDGTNDAAALNEADIGFAMASGTQIAVHASDIVLLDDNFSSIVNGIRWGRNVYDGIRKFLQFQLSVNIAAVIITLVGSLLWGRAPLNSVQLLWVNLIMDSLGAVALASDRPSDEILDQKPHSRTESMFSKSMMYYMGTVIVYQLVLLLCLLFFGETMVDFTSQDALTCTYDVSNVNKPDAMWLDSCRGKWRLTVCFTTFIMLQVFNLVTTRQLDGSWNILRGLGANHVFLGMVASIIVVQVIVVQFGGAFVGTVPLGWQEWLLCTAWAAGALVWVVATRLLALAYFEWRGREDLEPAKVAEIPTVILADGQVAGQEVTTVKGSLPPADAGGSGYLMIERFPSSRRSESSSTLYDGEASTKI